MTYSPSFNRDPRGNFQTHRNANFVSVQAGTDAYLLEDELNEMQWIQNEARASLLREISHSGFLDIGYNDHNDWYRGIYKNQTTYKTYPNALLLHPNSIRALVNGYIFNVFFDKTVGGSYFALNLPSSPVTNSNIATPGSARNDFVFLEVWFQTISSASTIYDNGNDENNTIANDLVDIRIGGETTQRVQLRWNVRIATDTDFITYPEGFARYGDVQTGSQHPLCNLTSPTTMWTYHQPNPTDDPNAPESLWRQKGVYVAGDGSSSAQQSLGSVDGYAYAIPMFCIRRRNNQPFDAMNNPLGGITYVRQNDATQNTTYSTGTVTFNLASVTNLSVGQNISINGSLDTYISMITNVNITNNTITVQTGLPRAQSLNFVETISDRPDGLFNNIIDITDITDLRHVVGPRQRILKQDLEQGLDMLMRNELPTHKHMLLVRDFAGLPLFSDDSYTLLLTHFDGNMTATSNGTQLTTTGPTPAWSFVNGPCVQGVDIPYATETTANAFAYNVNVAANLTSLTLEFCFKPSWYGSNTYGIFSLLDSNSNRNFSLNFNSATAQFECYFNTSGGVSKFLWDVPNWMVKEFTNDSYWHKLMFSFSSTGTLSLVVNNIKLSSKTNLNYPGPFASASSRAYIGFSPDTGTTISSAVDEFRLSNILRSETQLRSNFSGYQGDHIIRGADGTLDVWSDLPSDKGGLSFVPNVQPTLAYLNGSVINEYVNTTSIGWKPASVQVTNEPTGIQDRSALEYGVTVTSQGTSTFLFTRPVNVPSGKFLATIGAAEIFDNAGNVIQATLAVDNSTSNITATTNSVIASGTSLTAKFLYGDEHIHVTPSTKGFQIHDWMHETYGVQYSNNPSTAPTLTAQSSGSLAGGSGTMYYVQYTWSTQYGETLASPEASILLVTGQNAIEVTTPNIPSGATSVNIYIGQSSGNETLSTRSSTNVVKITSMPSAGSASVPMSNTAQITSRSLALSMGSNGNSIYSVNNVRVTPNGSNTSYIIPQSGLPANAPGGPGFAVPSWSVTDSNSIALTLPSTTNPYLTFSGSLPNGAIVDVVYECSIKPAVTDEIIIVYQTTPYQGLLGSEIMANTATRFPVLEVLDYFIVNTNGTGVATATGTTSVVNDKYVPLSVRMPMGIASTKSQTGPQHDHELAGAAISFSTDATAFAGGVTAPTTMRKIPYGIGVVSYDGSTTPVAGGSLAISGAELTNVSNAILTCRGMAGSNGVLTSPDSYSGGFVFYGPQSFATAFTKQVIFAGLVQLKNYNYTSPFNDEIALLVASRLDNTDTASIGFNDDWTDVAFDLFHIIDRPLLR